MNIKGQGLPMTVIVIMVLCLVVLIALGLYFLQNMASGNTMTQSALGAAQNLTKEAARMVNSF